VWPKHRAKEGTRIYKTLVIYICKLHFICLNHKENILKDPSDESKRKINITGKGFHKRIGGVIGGKFMMKAIGFVEEDGFFVMKHCNT